jgi:subtilisin family serine protease
LSSAARLLSIAALTLVFSAAANASTSSDLTRGGAAHLALATSSGEFVPGEVIVRFRAGASRMAERRANARAAARVTARFPALRLQVAKIPHGLSVAAAVRRYESDPAVEFAEPNYLRHPTLFPTDTRFGELFGLHNTGQSHPVSDATSLGGAPAPHVGSVDADIDVTEAWDTQAGNGTVVAVLDTGVDVDHPDLATQLWTNPGEDCPGCQTNGLDDDNNGLVDDVHGWDFADDDATLLSGNAFFGYEHGTHVAGTVAGALDTTTGVVGVCPGCRIMVLKIARDNDGAMPLSAAIAAVNYAKAHGVRIANMSYGGPAWSNAERESIRTSGLLAVAAAGNESLDNDMALGADLDGDGQVDILSPSYPAAYTLPNILTVGASNDEDRNAYSTECNAVLSSKPRCAFTNWGHDSVDLSAPGVDITSAVPGAAWETWDGTSMAAPHVAGAAGLVLSQNPAFTNADVKNALMNSTDRPANLDTLYIAPAAGITGPSGTIAIGTGNSFTRTSGRLNALNALTGSTANATPGTDGNVTGAAGMSKARVSGAVAWPTDVNDVRKRKLYKGQTYRVTLVVPAGSDSDLYVWKPGTKEIWQFSKLQRASARISSADEVVKFKAGSTGVYFLHVMAWVQEDGNYTLKIAKL